ncbi:hypothetical protein FB451DRAFT_1281972 [Mycena latifolia]|nr:hypothetical protein FB451DRAFT_1281972 [Mycena latifolia]
MSSPGACPRLPEDLERLIFEISALFYPNVMPALLRVAQRVKIWIEPLLYRVIYDGSIGVWEGRTLTQLWNSMKTKPASFFHKNVRHVSLYSFDDSEDYDLVKILSVCGATINLRLLGCPTRSRPTLLQTVGLMPLQRLAIHFSHLFPRFGGGIRDLDCPNFTRLTHLSLADWDRSGWDACPALAHLSSLTHLSFHNNLVLPSIVQGAFEHFPSLEALALACSARLAVSMHADIPKFAAAAADPRFVMVLVTNERRDWEIGARGGDDFWVAVDAQVRKRRSGETKEYFTMSASSVERVG